MTSDMYKKKKRLRRERYPTYRAAAEYYRTTKYYASLNITTALILYYNTTLCFATLRMGRDLKYFFFFFFLMVDKTIYVNRSKNFTDFIFQRIHRADQLYTFLGSFLTEMLSASSILL